MSAEVILLFDPLLSLFESLKFFNKHKFVSGS